MPQIIFQSSLRMPLDKYINNGNIAILTVYSSGLVKTGCDYASGVGGT